MRNWKKLFYIILVLTIFLIKQSHALILPVIDEKPIIDGEKENIWEKGLILNLKDKKGNTTPETKVYFFSDGLSLYLFFYCEEPDISKLIVKEKDNDGNVGADDSVEIFIQPETDTNRYFEIVINPNGVIYDKYFSPFITEWTSKAQVKTSIGSNNYTVEISLPISSLIFDKEKKTWNFNLGRNRRRTSQYFSLKGESNIRMYHYTYYRLKEWEQLSLSEINFEKIVPSPDFSFPKPFYDKNRLNNLSQGLKWIKREKIRLYTGWPTDTWKRSPNWYIYKFLDKIAESKFNMVTLGCSFKGENPYTFRDAILAAIYANKLGLRVVFHLGGISYITHTFPQIERYRDVRRVWGRIEYKYFCCPLDEKLWQKDIEEPLNKIFELEDKEGIKVFTGCHFDLEFFMWCSICTCDFCFNNFLKDKKIKENIEREKRIDYLVENSLVDEYSKWQEEKIAEILSKIEKKIHKRRPNFLFCFYPWYFEYRPHYEKSIITRAVLKGLGRKDVPVIGWDDQTHCSGYSGNSYWIKKALEFTSSYLGYEPLHLFSINYTALPEDIYTPDKAANEYYLLVSASAGAIGYGEIRTGKGMWETHLPYWPEFKKAHERLLKEKIIETIDLPKPNKNKLKKLDRLKEKLEKQQIESWLKEAGDAFLYFDPEQKQEEQGNKIFLIKKTECYRGCDYIHNGTKGKYTFKIKDIEKIKNAKLKIKGNAQANQDNAIIVIKVNDKEISKQIWGKSNEKEFIIPNSLLEPKTNVEICYFNGDDYTKTYFDINFLLKEIILEIEKYSTI